MDGLLYLGSQLLTCNSWLPDLCGRISLMPGTPSHWLSGNTSPSDASEPSAPMQIVHAIEYFIIIVLSYFIFVMFI